MWRQDAVLQGPEYLHSVDMRIFLVHTIWLQQQPDGEDSGETVWSSRHEVITRLSSAIMVVY